MRKISSVKPEATWAAHVAVLSLHTSNVKLNYDMIDEIM